MRLSLAILSIIATSTATLAADVVLLEEATATPGALVRLRDVATVTGPASARLLEAPLMPSPVAGTNQYLSAGAVRDMLAAQGESPNQHRFRGAYRVRVSTPLTRPVASSGSDDSGWRTARSTNGATTAFRIRGKFDREATTTPRPAAPQRTNPHLVQGVKDTVTAALQRAIDQRVGETGGMRIAILSVQVSQTDTQALITLRGQPLVASFAETVALAPGPIRASVWAESRLDDEPFLVVAELIEQPMRVVATSPMSRGALITASSIRLEPTPVKEIGQPRAAGYTTIEDAIGKEASRSVRVGDVLSGDNTAPPVMVHRGEEVTVVSGGGGVSVRLRAMAKQDGRVGDLITVELLDRREKLMARVVGPRRLAVLSAGPSLAELTPNGGLR